MGKQGGSVPGGSRMQGFAGAQPRTQPQKRGFQFSGQRQDGLDQRAIDANPAGFADWQTRKAEFERGQGQPRMSTPNQAGPSRFQPWMGGNGGNASGSGADPRTSPEGLTAGTPWNGELKDPTMTGPETGGVNTINDPAPTFGNPTAPSQYQPWMGKPETGGGITVPDPTPTQTPETGGPTTWDFSPPPPTQNMPETGGTMTVTENPRAQYQQKLLAQALNGAQPQGEIVEPRMMFQGQPGQQQRSPRFQSPNGLPGLGNFVRRNVGQWNPGTGNPRPGPGGNSPPARGGPDYRGGTPYTPPPGTPGAPGSNDAPNRGATTAAPAASAYAPQNVRQWDGGAIDDLMGSGALEFTAPTGGTGKSLFNASFLNPSGADRMKLGGGMVLKDANGQTISNGQGIAGGSQIDWTNLTPGQKYFLEYSGIQRPTRIARMG